MGPSTTKSSLSGAHSSTSALSVATSTRVSDPREAKREDASSKDAALLPSMMPVQDLMSGNKSGQKKKPDPVNKRPLDIPALPQSLPQVANTPDWTDDDDFFSDCDLIDVGLLGLTSTKHQASPDNQVAKRRASPDNQVAKRQRVITSTQEPHPVNLQISGVRPVTPSAGSKLPLAQRAVSPLVSDHPHTAKHTSSSKDTDVSALRAYILACEEKINLLTKCNAVSDSTSLSLDAKKHWHTKKFLPKMKTIDEKVGSLRTGFTFLDPLPTDLSNIHSDASFSKTPSISIVSSPAKAVSPPSTHLPRNQGDVNRVATQPQSMISCITDDTPPDPLNGDYNANIDEARQIILERRNNPSVPKPAYDHIDDDDSEDNFGGDFMDGLQSSQVEDVETDLSGFLANDEDDEADSVDVTYTCTQATQFERRVVETDEDEHSLASDHEANSLHDELEDIRLSQDVANRLGVTYEKPARPVEIIDEDDLDHRDNVDGDELDDDEIGNFTTQLNEGRDEVVEIFSDFDDEELDSITDWPVVKKEPPPPSVHVISESDFSDDDDELLQLTKAVGLPDMASNSGKKRIPGSEPFIDEVYDVLRNTFRLPGFRSNQLEAVVSTLMGKDVFVLIPTGGGKSLCYQLPALVTKGKTRGTTVVISPLISLMQDQIHHLQKKNIRADMISSRGSAKEKSEVIRSFAAGNLDLVYLSPEMVNKAQSIRRILTKLYNNNMLARIVVDEAHCVSSWGHDFRPDYQGMSMFKEEFPDLPIMALTATANEKVRLDIIHNLRMSEPVLLKQSFNRTNLFYKVMKKPANVFEWLRDYISQTQFRKTGIIYCHSKNSCESTSEKLEMYGIKCKYYHAGMDPDERLKVQTEWQENKIQVICATIAFGMGIDKPDVRFVIHIYIPRTLEGYYQETGRAGRDGKDSECIMFYAYKDARTLKSLIEKDKDLEYRTKEMHLAKLRQVIQYCENGTDCRRRQVLHYFNEIFDAKLCKKKCDNCCSEIVSVRRDVTEHCSKIVKLVQSIHKDKITVIHCQDVYWGSKNQKIMSLGHYDNPYHGAGRDLDKGDMERIFFFLQCENALMEYQVVKGGYATSYVKLGPNANHFMKAKEKIELDFAKPGKPSSDKQAASKGSVKLTATGNGKGISGFRYQESFVSAREVRNQEDFEKENSFGRAEKVPSRIVLPQDTFDGRINDSNKDVIEKAYNELRNFRMLKSQELGYGRANVFISDILLKEMAIKLPTNARDFAKLNNVSKEQTDHFTHFKKVLTSLSRERKKCSSQNEGATQQSFIGQGTSSPVMTASPYFKPTQTKTSKSSGTQKSQSRGNKTGKNSNTQKKQSNQNPSKGPQRNGPPKHIRQMPI
ncbi:hypothetical protein JCM33374_g4437 [Metschnikowia sp. JCM 33374]|nr:hypothetical protein JCM33374_g4437 [Metschnikowia sp. JCM 33374]